MPVHTPALHTRRLILRQISTADLPHLYPISFYEGKPIHTEEGIRKKLTRINEDVQGGTALHWGIALKEENTIIGTIGFYRGFPNKTGEIGYVLNQMYRRQGYMLEAIREVVNFAFNTGMLNEIIAYTAQDNTPSMQLLLKAGFTQTLSDKQDYLKFNLPAPGRHS